MWNEAISQIVMFLPEIKLALWDTLYMVVASVAFAYLLGLPLGVILVTTEENHILANPVLNKLLGYTVNILRSTPFLILMVVLFPLTKLIVGKSIGATAAVVPLTVAAAPFVARVVETSLREVDKGVVEAARAMGASPWQIIWKVLLPEAKPGLVLGVTITSINLIGYTAMAGAIGAGGIGDLAIKYGYVRRYDWIMYITLVILVIIVQLVQSMGDWLAAKINKK